MRVLGLGSNGPPVHEVDALVLGAGLAGWRAAWAALETGRDAGRPLRVLVVGQRPGPAGSSFANRNRLLGMQFFRDPEAAAAFVGRALEIAAPGEVDPELVALLAAESAARFDELRGLGLRFRSAGGGRFARVGGCFMPEFATAALLEDLPSAFAALRGRCLELGGEFLPNWTVADLLADQDGAVGGALLARGSGRAQEFLAVTAKSVVLALGGPAPLFARDVSGPGNTGYGYGLLRRAGARLANAGYVQWMWHEVGESNEAAVIGPFFPLQELFGGRGSLDASGAFEPLPEELAALGPSRGGHCPFGYGLEDGRLDLYVAERMDQEGRARVWTEERGALLIAPYAHAGNGGAVVDRDGRSTTAGLFACGECATRMHGANRVGGAMVLATQVFGAAAGRAAAARAMAIGPSRAFAPLRPDLAASSSTPDAFPLGWLRRCLQRYAIFGGRPGLSAFYQELRERAAAARGWDEGLALESGLAVVEGLLARTGPRQ